MQDLAEQLRKACRAEEWERGKALAEEGVVCLLYPSAAADD